LHKGLFFKNGVIDVKTEKQLNALIYAIEQYPRIGRTKLMKFVFLVDLFMYNNRGQTLLEDSYLRLPNGPVPDIGFSYTDNSNAHFTVKTEPCDPERVIYQYTPLRKSDLSAFSDKERQLFDTIIRSLKSHKTEQISELTHRFSLWKEAKNGDIIPVSDLKLNAYEYDDLESFVYFTDAIADAKKIQDISDSDSDDRVPDDLVTLQIQMMCGEH
jgi:hypothetical protein